MMDNNKLKTIPELPKSLRYLSFKNNYVTELPILPPRLLSLNCENNKIEVLPILPYSLKILICNNNQIKNIDTILSSNLLRFDCLNNNLNISYNQLPSSLLVLNQMNIVKLPKIFSLEDIKFEFEFELEYDSDDNEVL